MTESVSIDNAPQQHSGPATIFLQLYQMLHKQDFLHVTATTRHLLQADDVGVIAIELSKDQWQAVPPLQPARLAVAVEA